MQTSSGDSSRKRSREPSDSPTFVTSGSSSDIDTLDFTALGIDPEEIRAQKELEERYSKKNRFQTEQDAAVARRLHALLNGDISDGEDSSYRDLQLESEDEQVQGEMLLLTSIQEQAYQRDKQREEERERKRIIEQQIARELESYAQSKREHIPEPSQKKENASSAQSKLEYTKTDLKAHEENELSVLTPMEENKNLYTTAEGSSTASSPLYIDIGTDSAPASSTSTPPTLSGMSFSTSEVDIVDLTSGDEQYARQLQDEELMLLDSREVGSSAQIPLVISSKTSTSSMSTVNSKHHWAFNSFLQRQQEGKGKQIRNNMIDDISRAIEEGYIKVDDDLLMKVQAIQYRPRPTVNLNQLLHPALQNTPSNPMPPISSRPQAANQSPNVGNTERRTHRDDAQAKLRLLLKTIENENMIDLTDRTGTPDGLVPFLMEHQISGLTWLKKMEESTNKGGILADDMGLGKTVQMLALMLSSPCTTADPIPPIRQLSAEERHGRRHGRTIVDGRIATRTDADKGKGPVNYLKTKSTLVVCPVSLIFQWQQEILTKTSPALKVVLYHGASRESVIEALADADVILTSYTLLVSDFNYDAPSGPLFSGHFHRIVLDEAHVIKNRVTMVAMACAALRGTYRWCLTATPIQNRVSDVYSLIRFLQIAPYNEWKQFSADIDRPLSTPNSDHAMKRMQILMKAILLRRTKTALIDGKPILKLPERRVHITHIDFTEDERNFYDYINAKAQARFSKYLNEGTIMKNYSNVLVMLLRLRQACLHPALTTTNVPTLNKENNDEEIYKNHARNMKPEIVHRLLTQNLDPEAAECPICMDIGAAPFIISRCGHCFCEECLFNVINMNATTSLSMKKCPQCRTLFSKFDLLPVAVFLDIHNPKFRKEKDNQEIDVNVKKPKEFISSKKIDCMLEILADTRKTSNGSDKTIIFTQFTNMLDIIEQPLKAAGYKYVRYDGAMTMKHKNVAVQKLKDDPEVTVMLTSMKCGSLGLNLTAANRVILLDVWWNPALENQAIDRVHRIGQTKDVEVHRILINDTVEDRILELQKKKQEMADGALSEGSSTQLGRLGFNELLHLFRGPSDVTRRS